MKSLIITAHPSSKGFTHRIAAAYKKGREEKGHTVEILDLYKTDLKQGFFTYEEKADMAKPDATRDAIQAKIAVADDIVFVHPMWWVGQPAILKNFLDMNLTPRFAYRYINGKPVGLLKGKTGSVFITCDGAWWIYLVIARPYEVIWRLGILRFCGLKRKAFKVLYRRLFATPEKEQKFLDAVYKIGKKN
jgi:NAD(P)H dehydrogenase (quinone)